MKKEYKEFLEDFHMNNHTVLNGAYRSVKSLKNYGLEL